MPSSPKLNLIPLLKVCSTSLESCDLAAAELKEEEDDDELDIEELAVL